MDGWREMYVVAAEMMVSGVALASSLPQTGSSVIGFFSMGEEGP